MVDGGFACPNRRPKQEQSGACSVYALQQGRKPKGDRDVRAGYGGCTYCRNDAFAPDYCREYDSITEQLEAGMRFFGQRYKDMEYIAYFQSYSGTYAPVDVLRRRYEEALAVEGICGIVIGTRPDCVGEDVLDYLQELSTRTNLTLEIGVESCHDHVLRRINRGHTYAQAEDAIRRIASRGIKIGVHMILGLPEETREEMMQGAEMLSALPIDFIKLHQLQILKGTRMADDFETSPGDFVSFPTAEDYVCLVREYMRHLRPDIKIERYVSSAPSDLIIAPKWGLKPYEIKQLIE